MSYQMNNKQTKNPYNFKPETKIHYGNVYQENSLWLNHNLFLSYKY
jgi:hypothetical protein